MNCVIEWAEPQEEPSEEEMSKVSLSSNRAKGILIFRLDLKYYPVDKCNHGCLVKIFTGILISAVHDK